MTTTTMTDLSLVVPDVKWSHNYPGGDGIFSEYINLLLLPFTYGMGGLGTLP
jgi:hypothetical protein